MPDSQRMVDVFLRYLKSEGARVVFGVPGGLLHPFFAAVERDPELQLVVVKHEEGAAFMADGYARLGRGIAVCAGTSGPGATNMFTGVACAFSDGVPMLVVTGQATSHSMGKGAAQEMTPEDIDIVAMYRPVTKYSAMVRSPDRLSHDLRRALRLALTGRKGPVHLNIPVDFWLQPAREEWFDPTTYRPRTLLFDRNAVAAASRVLLHARRPAILAGSGVVAAGAQEHLRTLVELLPAHVATTPRAKGVLSEDHPMSLGVLGFAGHRAAHETLHGDQVDVLFAVGASLNETTTLNWRTSLRPRECFIQLDIDVDRIGRNYPVDIALVGDAQTILIEIIYHLHRLLRDGEQPRSEWRSELRGPRPDTWYDEPELRASEATPLTPQRWRVELQRALPQNAVIFSDIGGHMLFNIHDLSIVRGQQFFINLGFGSMGHGTVAPIGAALAAPERPVFAIVGDACFTMNGMELLTAAEYDVPVKWLVENNHMHGITWHGSAKLGDPMQAIVYRRPLEVALIARAMGVPAWLVDRPGQLDNALRQALAEPGPAVIEIRTDPNVSPPLAGRAETIAGFKKS